MSRIKTRALNFPVNAPKNKTNQRKPGKIDKCKTNKKYINTIKVSCWGAPRITSRTLTLTFLFHTSSNNLLQLTRIIEADYFDIIYKNTHELLLTNKLGTSKHHEMARYDLPTYVLYVSGHIWIFAVKITEYVFSLEKV